MNRQVCPGSGLPMVEVDYTVRPIEPEDREKYQRNIQLALDHGDEEEAHIIEDVFGKWESEQGTWKMMMVCSVCQHPFLTPTKDGRARCHTWWSTEEPT